jgi:hypothetical protein
MWNQGGQEVKTSLLCRPRESMEEKEDDRDPRETDMARTARLL